PSTGPPARQMAVAEDPRAAARRAQLIQCVQKHRLEGLRRRRGEPRRDTQRLRLRPHQLDGHAVEAHPLTGPVVERDEPRDPMALTDRAIQREHRVFATAEEDGAQSVRHHNPLVPRSSRARPALLPPTMASTAPPTGKAPAVCKSTATSP